MSNCYVISAYLCHGSETRDRLAQLFTKVLRGSRRVVGNDSLLLVPVLYPRDHYQLSKCLP